MNSSFRRIPHLKPDTRIVASKYVIERRRAWAGSDTIMGYGVSKVMGPGWTSSLAVGSAKTPLGARRVVRLDQARDATIKACEDAARRLEHGPDPEASALIRANSHILLHSFAPIRVD